MNAPLPKVVAQAITRDNAASASLALAQRATPEAADLALRLTRETQGEVMFDAASRGRYATDASIYQIMPVGVFVPRSAADVVAAMAIARDLKVPLLPRGGGIAAARAAYSAADVACRRSDALVCHPFSRACQRWCVA